MQDLHDARKATAGDIGQVLHHQFCQVPALTPAQTQNTSVCWCRICTMQGRQQQGILVRYCTTSSARCQPQQQPGHKHRTRSFAGAGVAGCTRGNIRRHCSGAAPPVPAGASSTGCSRLGRTQKAAATPRRSQQIEGQTAHCLCKHAF